MTSALFNLCIIWFDRFAAVRIALSSAYKARLKSSISGTSATKTAYFFSMIFIIVPGPADLYGLNELIRKLISSHLITDDSQFDLWKRLNDLIVVQTTLSLACEKFDVIACDFLNIDAKKFAWSWSLVDYGPFNWIFLVLESILPMHFFVNFHNFLSPFLKLRKRFPNCAL